MTQIVSWLALQAAVDEVLFNSDIYVACLEQLFGLLVGSIPIKGEMMTWLYVKPEPHSYLNYIARKTHTGGVL